MACKQLLDLEGFGDVVVGTGIQPVDAVLEVIASGHDHDGRGGGVDELAGEIHAVLRAQVEIQEHQIRAIVTVEAAHLGSVGGDRHRVTRARQMTRKNTTHARVVFDDDNRGRNTRLSFST